MKTVSLEESLISKPAYCILNVYPLCNFRCKMCHIWQRKDFPMMSFEQIKTFIDALAEFTEHKIDINFIGGEPLLRKDIFDLISVASRHGLSSSLCSNGYLIDLSMAKRLSESGLKGVAISFESLDEKVHDSLRGKEGSFRKIMQAFEYLSRFTSEDFKVNIQTVISQHNLSGLVEIAKWVKKNDMISNVYYMAVVQPLDTAPIDNWQTKEPYQSLWPQNNLELNAVIDELIKLRAAETHSPKISNSVSQLNAFKSYFEAPERFLKSISCNLGDYALNVDYTGDCSPCFTLGVIGNVCREKIEDIWYSEKARQLRQRMAQCKKNCNFLINCYKEETIDDSKLSAFVIKRKPSTIKGVAYSKPPELCSIQVVNTCFLKCKMCYNWQNVRNPKELSIEDWKLFLDSLKEIVPPGFRVFFTGTGEPLSREGILELIEHATRKGFTVQMPTNGYLVDENMAKRLSDAGLSGIGLSLDSLNPHTHDFLRGVEGTYERVMNAIGYLRKNKVGVSLMATIMEKNLNEIIDLVNWCAQEKLGITFQAVSRPFQKDLGDLWYKSEEWNCIWPQDTAKAVEVINELIKLKGAGYPIMNPVGHFEIFKAYFENPERPYRLRRCNAGDHLMNLDIFGNIHPCSAAGMMGNIKENNIGELWFSEEAQNIREKIYACQKPCHHLINCFYEE